MHIYLIGYRCTGKTSVGKRLAARLDRPFVDTDAEVVREDGTAISEMVARFGWPYFREREKATLQRLSQQLLKTAERVISTGGGIVLDPENRRLMKATGRVIWLRATPGTILGRMTTDGKSAGQRPDLTDKPIAEEIIQTLEQRRPLYAEAADLHVDTDGVSRDAVCDRCLEILNPLIQGKTD